MDGQICANDLKVILLAKIENLLVIWRIWCDFIDYCCNNIPLQLQEVEIYFIKWKRNKEWNQSLQPNIPVLPLLSTQCNVFELYHHQNYSGNAKWCFQHSEISNTCGLLIQIQNSRMTKRWTHLIQRDISSLGSHFHVRIMY